MYLKRLDIVNFKNIASKQFVFSKKINCFVGNNGLGKTNILDAIYYLSFCKSYFNIRDAEIIQHDQPFFMLEGLYAYTSSLREDTVYCSLKRGQRKMVRKNKKEYDRLSDHIGSYPLVILSPYDRDLIVEQSDYRRRFMDHIIGQMDKEYLLSLLAYNRVLIQRNALLKYFAQNHTFDARALAVYDDQLSHSGQLIVARRTVFIKEFQIVFASLYNVISNEEETVSVDYQTAFHNKPLPIILQENLAKDRILQYTSMGIHRDDLKLEINGYPIKKFGSQGQQKSFTIALKLAQFEFIKRKTKIKPLLLLDDIFDKLDASRVAQLIQMVNEDHFGQIFITDTHRQRMIAIVSQIHGEHQIFEL